MNLIFILGLGFGIGGLIFPVLWGVFLFLIAFFLLKGGAILAIIGHMITTGLLWILIIVAIVACLKLIFRKRD